MTVADMTAAIKKLESALDLLHEINTKLYIADENVGPMTEVNARIEDALRAGYAAHDALIAIRKIAA